MEEIAVSIEWSRNGALFTDNRYPRAHVWRFDGGTVLAASSSPAIVPVPFSDPSAVDPEEAFVASLSSCHMLWFLSIAARAGLVVESYRDQPAGRMGNDPAGRMVVLEVTLRPEVVWGGASPPPASRVDQLHEQAHAECFLANSVRTRVTVQRAS